MIESYSFGTMTVKGEVHHHDLKIIGNRVIGNWWRREGHALHPEDIHDILNASVEILVVGRGEPGHLRISNNAARAIEARGIRLVALPTGKAVETYNILRREGKSVAGAFHLTC